MTKVEAWTSPNAGASATTVFCRLAKREGDARFIMDLLAYFLLVLVLVCRCRQSYGPSCGLVCLDDEQRRVIMKLDTITIYAFLAGQIHRACLNGQEVLKVQMPGLKKLFDIDLKNLRESQHIVISFF